MRAEPPEWGHIMKTVRVLILSIPFLLCCSEKKSAHVEVPSHAAASTSAPAPAVEILPSPAGDGAAEPFVSAARDSILLSWLEPVANTKRFALRFARLRDGRWSAPQTIVDRDDLFVNWADFPSVVEDANGALFAHWPQKSGSGTYSYDVRIATSTDGGATWSAPFLLNRDGRQAEHGFVTLSPIPGGGVAATWLDGRNMKSEGGHDDHEASGDMTLRFATVNAHGGIAGDVELDGRTCECCGTGMALTSSGTLIAYRDRSNEEIRDISYVRKGSGGWMQPAPLHADDWKIEGCPVNGPQVDAIDAVVATAWFTAAQDDPRAFVTFSADGGSTFGKPVQVDDGKPLGRVDVVLLDAGTALVTWLEQTASGAEIRARRVRRNGGTDPSMKIAETTSARAAGFARIARLGPDVYFAWTEPVAKDSKEKKVRVARMRF